MEQEKAEALNKQDEEKRIKTKIDQEKSDQLDISIDMNSLDIRKQITSKDEQIDFRAMRKEDEDRDAQMEAN